MKTKKIPISFNDKDQSKLTELIDLMGIGGLYGDVPKAVKFSINLAISVIKNPEKVYIGLNDAELEIWFQSVKDFEKRRRKLEMADKLTKEAKQYNPAEA